HSWVMSFDSEMESFIAWAEAMPNNSIFLVDTYNSLEGTRRAVEAGKLLRERGYKLAGIRLDSGDLAYLSIEARKILDDGGFPDAAIIGSGDLDEHVIDSLKEQGATIGVWGVGTKLSTAYDQPALGGIYKLTAVREPGGRWQPRIKLSEQMVKVNTPGLLQVRRYCDDSGFVADMIYDEETGVTDPWLVIDPADPIRRKHIPEGTPCEPLLAPVFRGGEPVYQAPSLDESRARTLHQLNQLHPGIKRLLNPHEYPAGLEAGLYELKTRLILEARGEG
ncbi:MAG: beta/alpha barrel domain-containing protein, partial [Armatimonadota bacterium]